jgi:hypothetical protein
LRALAWLSARHLLFYRQTVLKVPIRFEPDFSFNRKFTVDVPLTYWVAVEYDDIFRTSVEVPVPRDEFTAEFEVTSRDKVIVKGSTTSLPDWSGPWANTGKSLIRYLGSFEAKPRTAYSVSLRITSAQPKLISKGATAIVTIDWRFDEFRQLRETLLILIGAGIGTALLLLYVPIVLHWIRKIRSQR